MRRAPLVVILIVAFSAAGAALAPVGGGAPPAGKALKPKPEIEIRPVKVGGYSIYLTSRGPRLTLIVSRRHQIVSYETAAKVNEEGVEAKFGKLGEVSLRFEPDTPNGTLPPATCDAPIEIEGTFKGTASFEGEGGYVRWQTAEAAGEMNTIPPSECADDLESGGRVPFASRTRGLIPGEVLRVFDRRRGIALTVFRGHRGDRPALTFDAVRLEHREGMKIVRETSATGGSGSLAVDRAAATVTVRPPGLFGGRATFGYGAGSAPARGDLRAPFLGGPTTRLAGAGSKVVLGTLR